MTISLSTHPHVHSRRGYENWRGASPWKAGTAARQALGQWNQRGEGVRTAPAREYSQTSPVEPPREESESSASLSDVFAFVALLALAVAVISATMCGAQYVSSEVTRYTAMDVIRMFGGMP
jgi:hypothetical protein